jgi:hypothetical protein
MVGLLIQRERTLSFIHTVTACLDSHERFLSERGEWLPLMQYYSHIALATLGDKARKGYDLKYEEI